MPKFTVDQRVTVQHDARTQYVGVIVRAARNGQWVVREPAHGTECTYPERALNPA